MSLACRNSFSFKITFESNILYVYISKRAQHLKRRHFGKGQNYKEQEPE